MVKRVVASDVPAVVDMLVRAFDDDPLSNFVFSGDRRRHLGLHSFFSVQIRRQYLGFGHVYTTEGFGGTAVWRPPDCRRQGFKELFDLLPSAPYLVGRRMFRALQLLIEIDELHPKEPHWYLATLGTEPDRQGTGIGSALLATGLLQVDESGMPAYLESSKERNVPLYARFGFDVIEEFRASFRSPPLWRMWREPRIPEL